MLRLQTPDHAGSRDQAVSLVAMLSDDLSGETVLLDCSKLLVGTPSFLDEVVKQILQVRDASTLEVSDAPDRVRDLLERAAANRGVRDRLRVAVRLG
jgi:hypothetical protein